MSIEQKPCDCSKAHCLTCRRQERAVQKERITTLNEQMAQNIESIIAALEEKEATDITTKKVLIEEVRAQQFLNALALLVMVVLGLGLTQYVQHQQK